MFYAFLADVIVAVHAVYIAYVIVGQLFIFAGVLLGWQAARNPWFRWSHLIMIAIVALESLAEVQCPLTTWEYDLRSLAGQGKWIDHPIQAEFVAASMVGNSAGFEAGPYGAACVAITEEHGRPTFIGRCLHDYVFLDVPQDHVGFTIAYVGFAVLVVAAIIFAPPRRFGTGNEKAGPLGPALAESAVTK